MKKTYIFLISILLFSSAFAQSQSFSYYYDANGNRTQREVIVISDGGAKSAMYSSDSTTSLEVKVAVIHKDDISIYPNPTKGHLKVEINSHADVSNVAIDVYNIRGQSIYKSREVSGFYDIDLSSAVNGSYILVIRINESKYEWKIIKE